MCNQANSLFFLFILWDALDLLWSDHNFSFYFNYPANFPIFLFRHCQWNVIRISWAAYAQIFYGLMDRPMIRPMELQFMVDILCIRCCMMWKNLWEKYILLELLLCNDTVWTFEYQYLYLYLFIIWLIRSVFTFILVNCRFNFFFSFSSIHFIIIVRYHWFRKHYGNVGRFMIKYLMNCSLLCIYYIYICNMYISGLDIWIFECMNNFSMSIDV